jgi:hypothetical protein
MASLNWIATAERLQPALLTVQAQQLAPNDQGNLLWDVFFTRQDVDSVDLDTLTSLDYRPTADRREWNAPGRRIPILTPDTRKVSMVPIEANFVIDEKEMQKLGERVQGNAQLLQEAIGATIPRRVDMIAMACWRRHEVDTFGAWANGQIVQRNPENAAQTFTMSFGFSSARYTTAGTAWNDPGVNAYDLFMAWLQDAEQLVGPVRGAVLRLKILKAILADAPDLPNGVLMTLTQLEDRIQQDKGTDFEFSVVENTVDIFDDGGTAKTRTNVWPAGKIAAVPAGGKVGTAAFAPVLRAWEVADQIPDDVAFNVRGVTVFPEVQNSGKRAEFQAQLNSLSVPNEQLLFVTATGVT